jgi:hypothetical protein
METTTTWGGISLIVGLASLLFGLLMLIAWVWMLVHAVTNGGLSDTEKVVWVLLIVLLPLLGMILYFFIGRPKKRSG